MTWTRAGCCALVVAVAGTLAPAADARSVRASVPGPGHVSVHVVKITVKGKRRGLPKRLKLRPQKLKSLPPSVRVLYAQRTLHRKRSTVYTLALITVNAAAPAAKSAQSQNDDAVQLNDFWTVLIFLASPSAAVQFQKDGGTSGSVHFEEVRANNADLLNSPQQARSVMDGMHSLVDPNGDGKPDPGLDTGHYDDGHAFGWSVKSKADEKKTWAELTKQSLDEYILQLEESFQYDVDGDGAIESPSQGGGQQIDTQVGAPVVTGGG